MQLQLVQTVIDGFTCQPIRSPPQGFCPVPPGWLVILNLAGQDVDHELCELVGVAGVLLAFRAARHLL